ncbi:substrate-binding domain-containing protein [Lyngbya aestuarii]|uniref:substrate-binding domain-containing protein n=1 Tax=Lyngbya aestuarii TaxID=118322 RepID=UPI00403DD888
MSQKNETLTLVLALLITAALLGAGFWWFTRGSGLLSPKTNQNAQPQPQTAQTQNSSSQATETSQTLAQVPNVPSGLFNYGGSTSWAPIRLSVDSAIQAARPEIQLRYVDPASSAPSSTKGIEMLIEGKLAFAQSSRPILDQEYSRAQPRGFTLQQIPVAIDGLAVAVNPSLNIAGLTLEQLRAIYTGEVTNWQQLGGPNLPIIPYSRPVNSGGTVELFREDVLGGQGFGANVQFVPTTTEALRELGNNTGGIYFASAPEVVPQCTVKPLPLGRTANQLVAPYQEPLVAASQCPNQRNQLNINAFQKGEYPLTRNLFVVVKQNGQVEEQAGTAYANLLLSNQGQELISQAGFVRIR